MYGYQSPTSGVCQCCQMMTGLVLTVCCRGGLRMCAQCMVGSKRFQPTLICSRCCEPLRNRYYEWKTVLQPQTYQHQMDKNEGHQGNNGFYYDCQPNYHQSPNYPPHNYHQPPQNFPSHAQTPNYPSQLGYPNKQPNMYQNIGNTLETGYQPYKGEIMQEQPNDSQHSPQFKTASFGKQDMDERQTCKTPEKQSRPLKRSRSALNLRHSQC